MVPLAVATLTPCELEVLRLLARGLSNQEISRTLCVSEATTKTHVSNLLAKLQVTDREEAVIAASENRIVVPGENPSRG